MPQMYPLNWILLFLTTMILLLIYSIMIFFMFNMNISKIIMHSPPSKKISLKW